MPITSSSKASFVTPSRVFVEEIQAKVDLASEAIGHHLEGKMSSGVGGNEITVTCSACGLTARYPWDLTYDAARSLFADAILFMILQHGRDAGSDLDESVRTYTF